MRLDDVCAACEVVAVDGYMVLFGDLLATHVMVVQSDEMRDLCYFCGCSTQGRLVHFHRLGRLREVTAIDVCCEPCHSATLGLPLELPRADFVEAVLVAVAKRNKRDLGGVRREYEARAASNASVHADMIGRARAVLTSQTPAASEGVREDPVDAAERLLDEMAALGIGPGREEAA